jgi:hypothetical protein
MKLMMIAPGTKRLKLRYDVLLSSFAFTFNLRRYNPDMPDAAPPALQPFDVHATRHQVGLYLSN